MQTVGTDVIGVGMGTDNSVDNRTLIDVNAEIRNHMVELVGEELRGYMTGMKAISSAD
jgi:ketol-acid reductoisomerase